MSLQANPNGGKAVERSARGQPQGRYPLSVENVGGDTYIVMSRGHHDTDAFMAAVREAGYDWPLGVPEHRWIRVVPAPRKSWLQCLYVFTEPHARGAFPATYAWEAYGEDRYEAKRACANAPGVQGKDVTC